MKKLNYFLLGLAGLTLASCSNDDLQAPADGTYQLTVNLPKDIATRAIGDDITAPQTLYYSVFQVEGTTKTLVESSSKDFGGATSTTLSLPLVKGNTYSIAFFSQATANKNTGVYTYTDGTVKVDYSQMTGSENSADGYDCFSANYTTDGAVAGAINETITLTRPVAQINWGTNDLTSAAVKQAFGDVKTNVQTTLQATVPNTFNVLTEEYGEAELVTLPAMALPSTNEAFPVSGYNYLAMQYVLADGTMTSNLKLSVTGQTNTAAEPIVISVDNAPLQTNYRTNIYGGLLTDQANFNVTLSSTWGGEYIYLDGVTATIPEINTTNKTVTVNEGTDLNGIAGIVNGSIPLPEGVQSADFAGYTITLSDDIDFKGEEFMGIGTATRTDSNISGTAFRGTFNGNGKTIKNVIISYDGDDSSTVAGFIPNLDGTGKLTNVTFEGVSIKGGKAKQAGIVGTLTNGATVSDVTVTSGTIESSGSSGAIVGRMIANGNVTNCKNGTGEGNGATITGSGNTGGIVGAAYYTKTGVSMKIENCYNYGDVNCSGVLVGGIAGLCAATVEGCYNYGNITGTSSGVGGIVGEAVSTGGVNNSVNYGTITGGQYVGGICGWLTYYGAPDYEVTSTIVLNGNTNYGEVSATNGAVGGILGMSQNGGIITNNTNEAPSLSAKGSVAGIAGSITHPGNNTQYNDGYIELTGNVNKTPLDKMTGNPISFIYNGVAADGSQSNTQN